ncbi:WxL domain-containing protein [Enterococcus sp. CWB-B31]|uniref:WxL domain-containing protein n=1 Tax=Enterococcus sp. CWB-B31 TaxID=2885159 RepID=UPI001E4C913A|nr:WxL domain-containing protein [Enterococcus sp. CWB-B31]MCB5956328.1 WxL domain-containing protein [Enterococcus sp. CWB-B31]
MLNKKLFPAVLLSASLLVSFNNFVPAEGTEKDAAIEFTRSTEIDYIVDPEKPENEVNPGESPSTSGRLRIDFVPQLNFSSNVISDKEVSYPVNAQLFLDGQTSPRGNFIQLSDYRTTATAQGWKLQVRQENQFSNSTTTNSSLNGAVLSFDKSWTSTPNSTTDAPVVSSEIIRLSNIGDTYDLATAETGSGAGTWSISFGASEGHSEGQSSTLSPKTDANNEPVLDSAFNSQQVYENSAIKLTVPGGTQIDPVPYSTVITWILAELP